MRTALVAGFAAALAFLTVPVAAQRAETFETQFEWVPIGGAERNEVAGEGSATAKLVGSNLTIEGTFAGLPAKVTGARLRQGVAPGARGPALVIADLRVTGDVSGTLAGDVPLNPDQVTALKDGQLYVEIYSEKGVLPDHATLFGWLLR